MALCGWRVLDPSCFQFSPKECGQTDEVIKIYLLITLAFIPMSRKFKIRDPEAVHFVAFTTIHWLDPLKRDTCFYSTGISRYFSGKHSRTEPLQSSRHAACAMTTKNKE